MTRISDLLKPILLEATDSIARLLLQPRVGTDVVEITGSLNGPHCADRRTLAATFPLQTPSAEAGSPNSVEIGSVEILVTEPCYWTPSQPFSYQLNVTVRWGDGDVGEFSTPISLRRLSAQGSSLFLERKRTVFRGARVDAIGSERFAEAREAELVLLGADPGDSVCEEASRRGVGLMVDLRGTHENIATRIAQLDWHPAVLVVLLDAEQLRTASLLECSPRGLLIAQCIAASTAEPVTMSESVDMLVVELNAGECPPDWVPRCNRPTIALRNSEPAIALASARGNCDRLQAELAPQCNLAGYVV